MVLKATLLHSRLLRADGSVLTAEQRTQAISAVTAEPQKTDINKLYKNAAPLISSENQGGALLL